jgi:hypothetical protein
MVDVMRGARLTDELGRVPGGEWTFADIDQSPILWIY